MTLDYFYGQAGELFSFFRIPKALFQEQRFQDLSTDAKTLYGILLDRMSLSVKNGWLDEQNRVFIIFTIEDPSVTDDVKEISSSEDIELALKLTGFLKYDLFGEVNSEEEPAITITYFLKDGTSKTISANNTTVWWNNKIHVIKDKDMFINLTEGIFFLEDLQTK